MKVVPHRTNGFLCFYTPKELKNEKQNSRTDTSPGIKYDNGTMTRNPRAVRRDLTLKLARTLRYCSARILSSDITPYPVIRIKLN